jgi:DNA-binding CsgD family transcriptional regulator
MGGTVIETESERVIRKERCEIVMRMLRNGKTPEEIADFCDFDLSFVQNVEKSMMETV